MSNDFVNNFSNQSKEYSFSRPLYPDELFKFLIKITPNRKLAWDCATGNGQAAIELCKYFDNVIASDVSDNQIKNRFKRNNISYKIFPAEKTTISNNSIDLITVAQGLHWFNFKQFYSEVRRVIKKEGVIAVWSYGMHKITPEIDKIMSELDVGGNILGNYWAKETQHIKENYKTIPFPFKKISTPQFTINTKWNMSDLFSYLNTWSSVQKFCSEKNIDPLLGIKSNLKEFWNDDTEKKSVTWTLNVIVGKMC